MLLEPEPATAAAAAAAAAGGTAAAAAPAPPPPPPPPPGSLLDITPRQCATNLPLLDALGGSDAPDEAQAEAELSPHGEGGGGADGVEIAHGPRFVGRHLEMHAVIHAVLSSHLTAVYGAKG